MPNGPALAAHLRLPRHDPPRPRPDARRRRERRLCRRLAHGLTPAQAARAEGAAEAEVRALLADPDFAALAEAYGRLRDAPEAEQRERLRRLARDLLTEAVIDGDMRAACFVFREEARGRDPAATLADGVVRAVERPVAALASAATPAALAPAERPAPPRPPADPADRAAWRVAADLRDAVVAEHAVLHSVIAEPAAEPTPAISRTPPAPKATPSAPRSPAPAGPAPNRHQRRRLAAQRRGRDKRAAGGLAGNRGPPR